MKDLDLHHRMLLARVAHLYYEEELTQQAIAERVSLSRVKVHRLLKEARENSVVSISIEWPLRRRASIEAAMATRFGLIECVIVERDSTDGFSARGLVGAVGARFLEGILAPDQTLAVCLGTTTRAVIDAMRPSEVSGLRVAQAIGSLPVPNPENDSGTLARRLAEKLGGVVTFLRAPPLADSPAAAATISDQRDIHSSLEHARSADVALVGIGSLKLESATMHQSGAISASELAEAKALGAVGDIAWRLLDSTGTLVDCVLNERVIGVSLDDLRKIPMTIAAAVGSTKVAPIIAALSSGAVDVLCTDVPTAEAVLSSA